METTQTAEENVDFKKLVEKFANPAPNDIDVNALINYCHAREIKTLEDFMNHSAEEMVNNGETDAKDETFKNLITVAWDKLIEIQGVRAMKRLAIKMEVGH